MPQESTNFEKVDKYYRDIMGTINIDSSCFNVVKIESIFDRLDESKTLLEQIQKGLNSY